MGELSTVDESPGRLLHPAARKPIFASSPAGQWQSNSRRLTGPIGQPLAPVGRTQRAGVEKPALTVAKDAPDSSYGASEEPKETADRQPGRADTVSSGLGSEKGEQRGARLSAASPWRLGQQGRLPHGPSTPAGRGPTEVAAPAVGGSASRAPTGSPGTCGRSSSPTPALAPSPSCAER